MKRPVGMGWGEAGGVGMESRQDTGKRARGPQGFLNLLRLLLSVEEEVEGR